MALSFDRKRSQSEPMGSESELDDIVGGTTSPAPTCGGAPRRASSRPPTTPASKIDDAKVDEAMCIVCLDATASKERPYTYKGHDIHAPCKAAIRAYARLLQTREQREQWNKEFHTAIATWRSKVTPLIVAAGERRSAQARALARDTIEESYQVTEQVQDYFKMNLRHYTSYRGFWDKLSDQECEVQFEDALADQGSDLEDSDGEPCVWVKAPLKESKMSGKKSMKRKTTANDNDSVVSGDIGNSTKKYRPLDLDDDSQDGLDGDPVGNPSSSSSRRRFRSKGSDNKHGGKQLTKQNLVAMTKARGGPATPKSEEKVNENKQVALLEDKDNLLREAKKYLEEARGGVRFGVGVRRQGKGVTP